MLIRVQDLELRKIHFEEEFQPGAIDFGADVRQVGALRTKGHAELVREHHGGREVVNDIRFVGKFVGRLEVPCARCLESVRQEVSRTYDLLYRPLRGQKGSDEVSISEAETEIGYYSGEGMELEDALRERILLAVPIKTLCRPDCKGLCPHCGRNLNQESCECHEAHADPRWDALQDLKNRLQ